MNCLTPPHRLLRLPTSSEWSRNDIMEETPAAEWSRNDTMEEMPSSEWSRNDDLEKVEWGVLLDTCYLMLIIPKGVR